MRQYKLFPLLYDAYIGLANSGVIENTGIIFRMDENRNRRSGTIVMMSSNNIFIYNGPDVDTPTDALEERLEDRFDEISYYEAG